MPGRELEKIYSHKGIEDEIYSRWEAAGYFTADANSNKPPFSVVIPPPNITGVLHIGHALDDTLQDIMVRMKRMQGYEVLWLPGTDHASISTHARVEAHLRDTLGKTRYEVGREKFLEYAWQWKDQYGGKIVEQIRRLGASCDWTRLRFTMDEGLSKAVRRAFVTLYDRGLIYKGLRIINWCPKCGTALSDIEVEHTETEGSFWHIRYPFADGSGYLTIATTRPETMLGDTAVAVHPEDERYTALVGRMLRLPLSGRLIPVVADEYVDREFGTGCVKVTPAHDPNDFEIGLRHSLPQINIFDKSARINENGGKYAGQDRYVARKNIVADLEAAGLLERVERHVHNVGHCDKCGTVAEPTASEQWFVKMKPLAEPAMRAARDGTIKFVTERSYKLYMNWLENIHDWCISRQLWWGHRIPAYYCDACGGMHVSEEELTKCPKCGGELRADEDVLDTWFSSGLWPFSTLGWPDDTADFKKFFPTSVIVPGIDIIFFWVVRMVTMSYACTGRHPFDVVYLHGLVRDDKGRKMSKSSGNGVDPLELIEQYGTDALRYSLIFGNAPGNDMRLSIEKVEAARNFLNKIWNAARFVLMNCELDAIAPPQADVLRQEDKWILSCANRLVREVTENLENFELGVAQSKLYDFLWDDFCDWYIELVKPRLQDKASADSKAAQNVLCYVLKTAMALLHPFIPFITEQIWLALPADPANDAASVMISRWPRADAGLGFPAEGQAVGMLIGAIRAIRNRRAEMGVAPSHRAAIIVETQRPDVFSAQTTAHFQKLAGASEVRYTDKYAVTGDEVQLIVDGAVVYIPMAELVDTEAELARLNAERKKIEDDLARAGTKLANADFVAKAPERVVNAERERIERDRAMLVNIDEAIKKLTGNR